ncbi:MAG: hypothetical protein L0Z51_05505 [Candidatus Latescibacteria bacterium]|nr:hypothetical protein [Candidatus Latescibacterota bacterium]
MNKCLAFGTLLLVVALAVTGAWSPAGGVCYLMCPLGDNAVTDPDLVGTRTVDFNLSGVVDVADFALFGAAFGDAGVNCVDLDCDELVDLADFARFGAHFGHAGGGFTTCVL